MTDFGGLGSADQLVKVPKVLRERMSTVCRAMLLAEIALRDAQDEANAAAFRVEQACGQDWPCDASHAKEVQQHGDR